MFLSFKNRMIAVTVVILTTAVLLETPWQPQTQWVMEYILGNHWNLANCSEVLSLLP